jgi:hypothetical protein
MKQCEKSIIALEIKHKFRDQDGSLPKKALIAVQQSTGMFISHFLTKERYFQENNFSKIFGVNRVFSILFAPRHIVLNNVIESNKSLYGTPIDQITNKLDVPVADILKSLVMNLMISFFSLLISPFRSLKAIKYQLEAVKWSLRASNYYAFEEASTLDEIITRFCLNSQKNHSNKCKQFYNRFLDLRSHPSDDLWFTLRSPVHILKIHRIAIMLKNYLAR